MLKVAMDKGEKKVANQKGLLYSTEKSAQCYMVTWVGGKFGENGSMYLYDWVPLLSTRDYENIVNILEFKKRKVFLEN